METKIETLAIEAGFNFDSRDRNFYPTDDMIWLNSTIIKFARLIAQDILQSVDQFEYNVNESGPSDYIKREYGVK